MKYSILIALVFFISSSYAKNPAPVEGVCPESYVYVKASKRAKEHCRKKPKKGRKTASVESVQKQEEPRRGCCSWHGGVCGCAGGSAMCCDGTASPSCGCD